MEIKVLYEDNDVIAVNKPAGVLVHGVYDRSGPKHEGTTLADWIIQKYPEIHGVGEPNVGGAERAGIVHRLDKETSGVMVIAKTQAAFTSLKEQFQERSIQKEYLALVWGRVKNSEGVIDKPISIKDGSVKRTVFKGKMPREAVTKYRAETYYMYENDIPMTLLRVIPKTGRTHQIRVHLNAIGHPVVGDKLYGKKEIPERLSRHFLHAASLIFTLPGGKKIAVDAPLSKELDDFLSSLTPSD